MNYLERNIQIFKDVYKGLLNDHLQNDEGLVLGGPHLMVRELIIEITDNKLSRTENKKYFQKKFKEILKEESKYLSNQTTNFSLIDKNLHTERLDYLLEICRKIEVAFDDGKYFKSIVEYLIEVLSVDNGFNNKVYVDLKNITQKIIIELILKGYNIKYLHNLVDRLFDEYTTDENGNIISNFPYEILNSKRDEWRKNPGYNENENLKVFLQNLTIKDRIQFLNYFIEKNRSEVIYVFAIEGLKDPANLTIGKVTFQAKEFPSVEIGSQKIKLDNFNAIQNEDDNYAMAFVQVNHLTPDSSLDTAILVANTALSVLSLYINHKVPLRVITASWKVISYHGSLIQWTGSPSDKERSKAYYQMNAYSLSKGPSLPSEYLSSIFEPNILDEINQLDSKLSSAIHWHRKAKESKNEVDQLLFYWISIENIFNVDSLNYADVTGGQKGEKQGLIKKVIVSSMFMSSLHDKIWNLYWYYRNVTDTYFGNPKLFPEDVMREAQLNPRFGEDIVLELFFSSLHKIRIHEQDEINIEKIDLLSDQFTNAKSHLKLLKEIEDNISDDVLLVYRFRNLIVHNAKYNSLLLPYFIWKAKNFSGVLIRSILKEMEQKSSHKDCIINIGTYIDWYKLELDFGRINCF